MSTLYIADVTSERMLSLFSASDIEQPYRFQPYVKLIISFKEYRRFVQYMLGFSVSWLSFGKNVYERAMKNADDTQMLQLYYYDVSRSIMSEVINAAVRNEEATIIVHHHDNVKPCTEVSMMYHLLSQFPTDVIEKAKTSLQSEDLPSGGVVDEYDLSEHNRQLYRYSVFLRVLSFLASPIVFNVN